MAHVKVGRSLKDLSWRNPFKRILAAVEQGESGIDASGSSTGHSRTSSAQAVYAGSIATLCGRDYPISTGLMKFLKIDGSHGERILQGTVIIALQGVAHGHKRRRAAGELPRNLAKELASLLQGVCFSHLVRPTNFLSFAIVS